MNTANLILLALKILACSQKELAFRLRVSPTQITKWKNGDYMSQAMQLKIKEMIGLDDRKASFMLQAGSAEDAEKWACFFSFLAEYAVEADETGSDPYFLDFSLLESIEDEPLLHKYTLEILNKIGVKIPKAFPSELDLDYDNIADSDQADVLIDSLLSNPIASLVFSIYEAYIAVYGFYAAYINDLVNDLNYHERTTGEIEQHLLELAATKIQDIDRDFAPKFERFSAEVNSTYLSLLSELKIEAIKAGFPLLEEPLNLVYMTHDELGHLAEREALGFNDNRLHPDIYMNELLVGMRAINQVLPAILKKLDIEYELE